jgi:hypothetical protein
MNNFIDLKRNISEVAKKYHLKKVTLFGSRARGDNKPDSDIDLICEFTKPTVSLLTLSGLKIDLEEKLGIPVDVIHGPLEDNAIIEIDKEVPIYES